MATVHFYEKPGCLNNAKQKQLLVAAGHILVVYDLLQQPWAIKPNKLKAFFGELPVIEWFNYSAPAIKQGNIEPHKLDAQQAIQLMVQQPLLIRRPLIEVDGQLFAGFTSERMITLLNLGQLQDNVERCSKPAHEGCRW